MGMGNLKHEPYFGELKEEFPIKLEDVQEKMANWRPLLVDIKKKKVMNLINRL